MESYMERKRKFEEEVEQLKIKYQMDKYDLVDREFSGTVEWFNAEKGIGYIRADDGEGCFVHFSSLIMKGFKCLNAGQRVVFEKHIDNRGLSAKNVRVMS
jgi:CspA family cold shock protein